MASLFEKNIRELKGVGERRAKLFEKLGAPTVGALLRYYPRDYQDWSSPVPIGSAVLNQPCVIRATVLKRPVEQRIRKGMTLYKVRVTDGVQDAMLTYFNNPYIMTLLKEGEEYLFRGKMGGTLLRREMSAPEFAPAANCPAILPVYRQTDGLSSKLISKAVQAAFSLLPDAVKDPIPKAVLAQYRLCGLKQAIENIHFPQSEPLLQEARRRLVFEELLVLQLGLLRLRNRSRRETAFRLKRDFTPEYLKTLPYALTGAQKKAIAEGISDLQGDHPMNRLLQGDVGSGKTAVAAALCYSVIRNGMQAALMAPTEILAQQHFHSLEAQLPPTGIRIALLTGSTPAAKKRILYDALKNGGIDLLVGTHALISTGVQFLKLGLVVTDEQHRFGVSQRAALAGKGLEPHVLVMSATPIPRTLALMIYGDLDLSVLDELPPGRQKIDTFVIDSAKRSRAFGFIRKHLDTGRQCYIICPLIEESDNDMASVHEYADTLREKWFLGNRIGELHGRMGAHEKERIMSDFSSGKLDILVSTTVVEVGVDVPNATVMLIENAERYGLSQLHQLRGRIGRGTEKSTCILISDAQNEDAKRRLKIMSQTSNGFRIADEDLKLRGPGDFFGARQHGLPDLKIADMSSDLELLKQAQQTAIEILAKDDKLEFSEHRGLRTEVNQLFSQTGNAG